MINVVAGIIRNKDGKIFIAKRNFQKKNGGLWEFPGGKVEENETNEDALIRELREELNMDVVVDSYVGKSIYDYGDREIKLSAYNCTMISDTFNLNEHEDYKWVDIEELNNYEYPKNDIYFVSLLQNDIVELVRNEIIKRSVNFYNLTKGTSEEYNLYQQHVKYVYKYVCLLANNYNNIDFEVLKLSALLHDVSMTDINLGRENHNVTGLPIVEEILNKYNYSKDKIDFVKMCVLNHSSSRQSFRTTLEENILVDADCLSHFESVGSLYSLAKNVLGKNDNDSLKYVQDKLTKDYNELNPNLRYLVDDIYNNLMSK